jgi:hypothetical protein
MAAEGALMPHLIAFVNIFTRAWITKKTIFLAAATISVENVDDGNLPLQKKTIQK